MTASIAFDGPGKLYLLLERFSHLFDSLFPGTYSVNIVEPITGCSGMNSLIVKQVHIDLSLNAFSHNVSCFEGNDGYIAVMPIVAIRLINFLLMVY